MAHFARTRPDSAWVDGPNVLPADFQSIDQKTFRAINGDEGGTWTPSVPIVIAGAGIWIAGSSSVSGVGALIQTPFASGKRFVYGDNDYHVFGSPASRVLHSSLLDAYTLGGFANSDAGTVQDLFQGAQFIAPLRVHHGAKLDSVTFTFFVGLAGGGHTGVPANMPMFRVCSVDAQGAVVPQSSSSTVSGGIVNTPGFKVVPTPASGAAWDNGNAAQTFTYGCDSLVVDVTKYTYFVEVVDESGANFIAGNIYADAAASLSHIADTRHQ